ncbi:hypothetical protein Tco_0249372, partial [Tanacetum coccineum]
NLFFYSDRRKNHYVASWISTCSFPTVSLKNNVPQIMVIWHYCWKQLLNYSAGIGAEDFVRVVDS